MLSGLPGAGKTTLAEHLARNHGLAVVSRDTIRTALFDPCLFTPAEKFAAFEALLIAVRTLAHENRGLIVEGMPFSRPGELEAVRDELVAADRTATFIHLALPPEVAAQRIRGARQAGDRMAPDRDETLPRAVADRFRALPSWVSTIDATQERSSIQRAAETLLAS